MLEQQPNPNDGTVTGGLAYTLQQSLKGLANRSDQKQQDAASQALDKGMQAGGIEGAIESLAGVEKNPYARSYSMQLQRQKEELDRENARIQADRDFRMQMFDRQQSAADARADRQFSRQMELQRLKNEGRGPMVNLNLTPAQEAVDKAYAKEYVKRVGSGGDQAKQIGQLQRAASTLEDAAAKGPDESNFLRKIPLVGGAIADIQEDLGSVSGPSIGAVPEFIRRRINPEAVDTQEQIEEVVQRNLREVLGAQFTEKEGERLISRAYNPSLDEEINARRVNALLGAMEQSRQAQQAADAYFEQMGTMKGYQGPAPATIQDFDAVLDAAGGPEEPVAGGLEPGVEEDGYVFLGGDPSDPKSWAKRNQ